VCVCLVSLSSIVICHARLFFSVVVLRWFSLHSCCCVVNSSLRRTLVTLHFGDSPKAMSCNSLLLLDEKCAMHALREDVVYVCWRSNMTPLRHLLHFGFGLICNYLTTRHNNDVTSLFVHVLLEV
jgi:hypothetical protein